MEIIASQKLKVKDFDPIFNCFFCKVPNQNRFRKKEHEREKHTEQLKLLEYKGFPCL